MLATLVNNAKLALAAAAGAALVAGGSAVAITNVADSGSAPNEASTLQGDNRSDTATATIASKSPKPEKSAKADKPEGETPKTDNHGTCVSTKVHAAQDATPAGKERGKAVSAAAKSCPKPAKADKPASTEVEDADGADDAAETEDADEAKSDAGKSGADHASETGKTKRGGHGKG